MNELGKNGNKPATGNLAGYDQTQQPEELMGHEWLERFAIEFRFPDADRPEDQLAEEKSIKTDERPCKEITERTGLYLSVFDPQMETGKTKTEQVMDLRGLFQVSHTAAAPV